MASREEVGLDRDAVREVEEDPGDRAEEGGGDDRGRPVRVGRDTDALGADEDVDRPPARGNVTVDGERGTGDGHRTVAGQLPGHPVHGADELGDERCRGALVQLGRGCALLQAARVEDGDPVGHGEGLLLVVGDEDRGDPERQLEAADLLAQGEPDLGVECRERLVQEQDPGRRASARARATRCCWPPDISSGKRSAISVSFISASAARASLRALRTETPSSSRGSAMFSAAVRAGMRL